MHIVGAVEVVAGLIVLSRWTKIGSYIVLLWLLGIAVNLLTTGMFYDLAMRDVEIAIGAFVLSQLTVVREQQSTETKARCKVRGLQPRDKRFTNETLIRRIQCGNLHRFVCSGAGCNTSPRHG